MNNTLNYLYVTNFYLSKNSSCNMVGLDSYNILEKNLKIVKYDNGIEWCYEFIKRSSNGYNNIE